MRTNLHVLVKDFRRDLRGVFALWVAMAAIPLLLLAGAGLDLMRAVDLRAQLQAAVDSAALAGATAYTSSSASSTATTVAQNYMAGAIAKLTANSGVTYNATPSTTTSGSATLYAMTVTATSAMPTTLMKMVTSSTPVKVTATAQNPTTTVYFTLSKFASNAADADAIYYYIVPSSGGTPSSSALNLLFSNTSSSSGKSVSVVVTPGQQIGLALKNVTGGIIPYGINGYFGFQGTTHWFYSHLMPPSSQAYYWVTQNCSLQTVVSGSSSTVKSGSCFSSLPSYATINCSQARGKTITYYWNDMGGLVDDKDYNDAVMTISCPGTAGSTQSNVILTK
ncbi:MULTISPECIES: pilus assembly protein TadG-related protein [unclassified Methylobacterium]|uniref:pilus assembly protein TadG-related protein n=1 Tax=unclassified Methylobacterium TaxID=2615210 RepID=UPI002269F4F5|nr:MULTISPECIES: pilus assembly protein TadG-related protein [unclassified Methylobacterium]